MNRTQIILGLAVLAAIGAAALAYHCNGAGDQLRGAALTTALQPIIDNGGEDGLVASVILQNYDETRQIAANWSGVYWTLSWGSAALGALAGFILKLESLIADERRKKDIAAFLAVAAALLVTISTSGDFQRKWQANRMAAAEIERTGYAFLESRSASGKAYLAEVGDALKKRHAAILGTDQRKPAEAVAAVTAAAAVAISPGNKASAAGH